jgi:hypothetical protein
MLQLIILLSKRLENLIKKHRVSKMSLRNFKIAHLIRTLMMNRLFKKLNQVLLKLQTLVMKINILHSRSKT